jgi:hypothetical protein
MRSRIRNGLTLRVTLKLLNNWIISLEPSEIDNENSDYFIRIYLVVS